MINNYILKFVKNTFVFNKKKAMTTNPDFLGCLLFLTVYTCVAKSLAKLHQCPIHNERHWIAFHLMLIKQQQTTPTENTQVK